MSHLPLELDFLSPRGLTIQNNPNDPDHDIDVSGGILAVHDFSDNWTVVDVPDETSAFQIDSTGEGGRINSSSLSTHTWYELGVIADSTRTNSPAVVGWTHTSSTDNTPTASGDLPSGYDLFRALGTPGRTWWVHTGGFSNIEQFFKNHSKGGIVWGPSKISAQRTLVNVSNPDGASIDISNIVPPVLSEVFLAGTFLDSDAALLAISGDSQLSDFTEGQVLLDHNSTDDSSQGTSVVWTDNQTLHIQAKDADINTFRIQSISGFEVII